MNYQIIATIGPVTNNQDSWWEMFRVGATAFRLNTSHLTPKELEGWLERLEPFLAQAGIPLVLDLQGSKWRLGRFEPFILQAGQAVELVLAGETKQPGTLPVPHPDFFAAAQGCSGEIVLDDARLRLQVEWVGEGRLAAKVALGGPIRPGKGVTLSAGDFRREALSEKDQEIIRLAAPYDFIQYAISYIKDAGEMQRVREMFGPGAHLIAKLERGSAMEDIMRIAMYSMDLWVCRGDLGAELGMAAMAAAVWKVSQQVRELGKPVIMAGQVLEHMTASHTSTRSEVCYLHDCLMQGYQGFVLSDETAVGKHPFEAVRAAGLFRTAA